MKLSKLNHFVIIVYYLPYLIGVVALCILLFPMVLLGSVVNSETTIRVLDNFSETLNRKADEIHKAKERLSK